MVIICSACCDFVNWVSPKWDYSHYLLYLVIMNILHEYFIMLPRCATSFQRIDLNYNNFCAIYFNLVTTYDFNLFNLNDKFELILIIYDFDDWD